ncbi:hypothetical protein VN97_g10811 [Penicillium thymicola]|uniref:Uncharacterized protein n=1 Tax=Penicillium thymicola TaxID=293382 RepID=A0AAI9T9D1_PENTH|nr:hypothetical protein VN97_g10811 [Penicillium thymicola]
MKLSNGSLPGNIEAIPTTRILKSSVSRRPLIPCSLQFQNPRPYISPISSIPLHYLSSSPSILVDRDRKNPTVQIAIHPHVRIRVLYLLKGSVMVIQVFIFSAGKYSGKFRHQYYQYQY